MKLNRKLFAVLLAMCMMLGTVLPISAAEIKAAYGEASYYDIAVTSYSRMLLFQNGVVAAADSSKQYGLIDATGKVVVPFQYAGMWALGGGMFKVSDTVDGYGGNSGIIDSTGKAVVAMGNHSIGYNNQIIEIDGEYFTTDMKPSTSDAFYGWSTDNGSDNDTPQYSFANQYDDIWEDYRGSSVLHVTKDGKQGAVDTNGKVLVPLGDYEVNGMNQNGYISAYSHSSGTTQVFKNGSLVKTFDKEVATEVYYRDLAFRDGESEKVGMMDINGKVIIPANYESINGDNNGNLLTVNEGEDWSYTYGLYSYDGKVIFKDGYEQLDYLKDNKYKLYDGTHYGVTALNGTAVIPMKYVDMRLHTMDFIELYDGKNYSIVDLSNQTIVPATTERIQLFHSIPGNPLSKDLGDAMWMAASYDGYKESELPFCYKLADGSYATVYADYNTGKVTGTLANRASLPNADGIFVYQATNGLFGFGNLNGDSQPNVPDQPTSPAQNAAANPTNDSLTADGELQSPTVYKINGSNYFKIRDLAAILNGTSKQFSVGYDAALNSVTATTGEGYEKQEGDLAGAPEGGEKTAVISNDSIYIDGEKVEAEVYKIDGNNYFKLRDLGKALDFYVGWTAERGVYIETAEPYAE